MIEVIRQQFKDEMDPNTRINITREFLQILCLKIMNEKRMFKDVAFLGGTALRILYDLRRFSEDLDFSSITKDSLDMKAWSDDFVKGFEKYGLKVDTKMKSVKTVSSIILKFEGILKELGLSEMESQKLLIKWDVDQNPPQGATTTNTIIGKHFMFNIGHYDLPSLFAGKLHACFYRTYIKGRDWYDLLWYVSKQIYPNFNLLQNAIKQTQDKVPLIEKDNFKDFLIERVRSVDFNIVQDDVKRFLEDKEELNALKAEHICQTIENVYR